MTPTGPEITVTTGPSATPRQARRAPQAAKLRANPSLRLLVLCVAVMLVLAVMTGPAGTNTAPTSGFTGSLGFPRLFWFLGLRRRVVRRYFALARVQGSCQGRGQTYAGVGPGTYGADQARPRCGRRGGRLGMGVVHYARQHLEGWHLHPGRMCPGGDGDGCLRVQMAVVASRQARRLRRHSVLWCCCRGSTTRSRST